MVPLNLSHEPGIRVYYFLAVTPGCDIQQLRNVDKQSCHPWDIQSEGLQCTKKGLKIHTSSETWPLCRPSGHSAPACVLSRWHPGAFAPGASQCGRRRIPEEHYEGQHQSQNICGGLCDPGPIQKYHSVQKRIKIFICAVVCNRIKIMKELSDPLKNSYAISQVCQTFCLCSISVCINGNRN